MENQLVKYLEPIVDIFNLMVFDIGMAVILLPYTLSLKKILTFFHQIGLIEKMLKNF